MRFLNNKKHDNQHTNSSPNNQDDRINILLTTNNAKDNTKEHIRDKSKGLKGIKQSVLHKIALCGSAILLFFSSCNSTAIVEQAPVEEIRTLQTNKTPELSTPTKELQNTVEVTEEVPTPTMEATPTEEVEATPEKEFDESTLNLVEWPNYELVETETFEKLETVHIKEGTRIFAFPYVEELFTEDVDMFEDNNPSINEFDCPKDFYFQIGEKRTIQNEKGESVTVGIVAGAMGELAHVPVFTVILQAQDANGIIKDFTDDIDPVLKDRDIITNVLINNGYRKNEYNSSLLSIYRFGKYQEDNGMFLANQEYSMEDILSPFEDFAKYPYNPEYSNRLYILGSSSLSTSVSALFRKNPEIGKVLVSRRSPFGDARGPFSDSQAWGVNMNANSPFVFELYKDGYLLIDSVVLPFGEKKIKSYFEDKQELLADYGLFYSITFVDSKDIAVQSSEEFIYDEETGSVTPILSNKDIKIKFHYITDNKNLKDLAYSLYTPVSFFELIKRD